MKSLRPLIGVLVAAMLLAGCAPATPVQTVDVATASPPHTTMKVSASPPATSALSDVVYSITDAWTQGQEHFARVEAVFTNHGEAPTSGWEASAALEGEIQSAWNCVAVPTAEGLLLQSESYNAVLEPGMSVAFGFIIKTASPLEEVWATSDHPKTTAPVASAAATPAIAHPDDQDRDWLFAQGNRIVDAQGDEVWITGVNWFGYNTGTNAFDGLWAAQLDTTVQAVADRGFNLIRVPFSVELIGDWSRGVHPAANINTSVNIHLAGMNSLEIFDYFLNLCQQAGLKVMIDIHSAKTDAMGHMAPLWVADGVTLQDYFDALGWMAARYSDNDTVIAYDLKNEPHGKADEAERAIWNDSDSPYNWKQVAEQMAEVILSQNPHALIVVEGIEIYPVDVAQNGDFASQNPSDYHHAWWGGNLRGVADAPVDLGAHQNKLVYSPHDYGPSVYEQPWFHAGYTFESIYQDYWKESWMFIHEQQTAPLLIGEWGGRMSEPNLKWMTHLRQLITENRLHHTFWCLGANSGDTGGLLLDDFVTWDEEKYAFVREALWQVDGRFVGLDAQVPLGSGGLARP